MMYGFGDTNSLPESIELMEDIAHEYIATMTHKALELSPQAGRLTTELLIMAIRKDRKKYARVKELLRMYEVIQKARKGMEVDIPLKRKSADD
mmetsp:Transcript_3651/g.5541  ORF Transcript_3651/g.5541 Transcript_3651/m.5541 type:complete len:93 (+) Transcript_3651:220-498(+)